MEKQPYKDEMGTWVYPELPDAVRPATEGDLIMPSGMPNYGKAFICYSYVFGNYIASKVYRQMTAHDIYKMLRGTKVYVKK